MKISQFLLRARELSCFQPIPGMLPRIGMPVDKGSEVFLNEHRNRLRILILVRPFVHHLLRQQMVQWLFLWELP
jgi:hypothetical protein